jgi:glycosyltransferase involved in cell wall biosynthesis
MGVPAIISNSGGLPESIIENKTGVCVNSFESEGAAKAIENLFLDKDVYFQFSEGAIKNANSNFTTAIEAKKLVNLYQSLYAK